VFTIPHRVLAHPAFRTLRWISVAVLFSMLILFALSFVFATLQLDHGFAMLLLAQLHLISAHADTTRTAVLLQPPCGGVLWPC